MEQNIRNLRFSGASWFPGENIVTCQVGGAGGIGSWLSFFLSRIGYNVVTYDFDIVEETNLAGQLYNVHSVGDYKVNALQNVIRISGGDEYLYTGVPEKITESTVKFPVCFSAFDNMQARKTLFSNWKESVNEWYEEIGPIIDNYRSITGNTDIPFALLPTTPIFIDGRLEAEQIQIFTCVVNFDVKITLENYLRYEATLFDDVPGDEPPCTMKQTSHTACMIGSLMTSIFTNHLTNCVEGFELRAVPFRTEIYTPGFVMQTEA